MGRDQTSAPLLGPPRGSGPGSGAGPGRVPCPAGGLRPLPQTFAAGPILPLGRTRAAFPGLQLPPARPAPRTPGAAPGPLSRPASRRRRRRRLGSAPPRPRVPGVRRGAVSACVAGSARVRAAFVCGRVLPRAAGQRACCRAARAGGEPRLSQGAPTPALSPGPGWPPRGEHGEPRFWVPEVAGGYQSPAPPPTLPTLPGRRGLGQCGTCPPSGNRRRRLGGWL